ncbi:MAG: exodeoxyribonuclease VII large subunit [bacterium]
MAEIEEPPFAFKDPVSVSQLNHLVKEILEQSLPRLWLTGEVSEWKRHSSGHIYFTLKDNESSISCVMWRWMAEKLRYEISPGLSVYIYGNINVYEKGGRYQFNAVTIRPAGIGAMQQAFEALKEKLFKEGLFREEHKRKLPPYPEAVGVATSENGAAWHDIKRVAAQRAPWINLILRPCQVQGRGAARDIARAINDLNETANGNYGKSVDVIIAGRGGGSLEDLWAFNEEEVVRAVYASKIPVVSAVGHEVDTTLSDYAADLRAPTPSAAAEMVLPDRTKLLETMEIYARRYYNSFFNIFSFNRKSLESLAESYVFTMPAQIIYEESQRTDELEQRLARCWLNSLTIREQSYNHLLSQLNLLNPFLTLERGYAMIKTPEGGIISNAGLAKTGDSINVTLRDGFLDCEVKDVRIKKA